MARSFTFNPLKTKIRNFSEELLSLYYFPEVITIDFPKTVLLPSLRVERLEVCTDQLCKLSFSFAKKHCDTAQKLSAVSVQSCDQ